MCMSGPFFTGLDALTSLIFWVATPPSIQICVILPARYLHLSVPSIPNRVAFLDGEVVLLFGHVSSLFGLVSHLFGHVSFLFGQVALLKGYAVLLQGQVALLGRRALLEGHMPIQAWSPSSEHVMRQRTEPTRHECVPHCALQFPREVFVVSSAITREVAQIASQMSRRCKPINVYKAVWRRDAFVILRASAHHNWQQIVPIRGTICTICTIWGWLGRVGCTQPNRVFIASSLEKEQLDSSELETLI